MAKVSALIVLLATILAGFSGRAFAEDSDGADHQPILTINVSMHTAAVRSVSADRSCALVATASDDKTVKLWRMPGGRLLDTIRLPIGPGNDGKMFAVAMAPQGDWLAAGGWSKTGGIHFVYVVHTATGVVAARLGPFKHVIDHLAISPDGRFLAATFRRGLGLRVWERSSENLNLWRLVRDDRNYSGKDVRAAAFGSNNVIYTVSYEGKLRRYSLDVGQPPLLKATSGGGMPSSIAVSNDGKKLAVGFADSPSVDLYDPDSLTLVRTIKNLDIKAGAFENVAWNRTGDRLFAGGSAGHDRHFKLRVWDKGGDAAPVDSDIADDSILQLASCGEGVAVAASDPAFGLVSGDGKLNQWQGRLAADMRGKLDRAFSISKDGLRVRYGLDFGIGRPVVFSVEDDDLADAPEAEADMFPPTVEGLPVTDWLDSTSPKLDGQELALSVHERGQSLAIAPDAARFVLGTDFYVRAYDAAGNELWKQQTPGVAWGVNISRDGRYAVAACGDGTIRWYELNNGTPLAALFVQAHERRWVVWTPKGYFSASAAGENLIGWHLNNGPGDAADFFPIYKFRDRYYQPDIVKKTLALASEDDAVAAAKTASSASASDQPVVSSFLPVIKIASPKDGATITGNQTSVKYLLRSAAGSGAIQVIGFAGGRQKTVVEIPSPLPAEGKDLEISLPLASGESSMTLIARSANGDSVPATVRIVRGDAVASPPDEARRPNLFAVVVGAGAYAKKEDRLPFSATDAQEFADLLEKQRGRAFGEVTVKRLIDRQVAGMEATTENFRRELSWLRQSARDAADVAVVFFSGHGKSIPGASSYLLPIDFDGNQDLTALDKPSMMATLRQVEAKLLIFVDACHGAGGLDTIDFVNTTQSWDSKQVMSFASSRRKELSYGKDKHSYFTQALIEGFAGAARRPDADFVDTLDLDTYLQRQVKSLALPKKQTPIATKSPEWEDVVLAVAK